MRAKVAGHENIFFRKKKRSAARFVVFKAGKSYDRLRDFLVSGTAPAGTTYRPPMYGTMQEGISAERIAKLDYLESFGSIPIFSGRFVTAMRGVLSREVEFFECTIMCEGQSFQFFAAKLLKRLQLIEYEKSGVSEEKISSLPDIVLRTFEDSFLIAREKNPLRAYVLIVTDEFRTEAAKYQLQMDFSPTQHDL